MNSKEKISLIKQELDKLTGIKLSVAEQGIVAFVKEQVEKEELLITEFENMISQKNFNGAFSPFFQLIQRTNLTYAYLIQPSILAMLSDERISKLILEVIDCFAQIVSDVIILLKDNLKQMGIESITVNINSNPPSINISMAIKSA